jgi:ATP synthase protein I
VNSSELPIEPPSPENELSEGGLPKVSLSTGDLPAGDLPAAGDPSGMASSSASSNSTSDDIGSSEATGDLSPEPNDSMREYYQLQRHLFKITLALTGIIFGSVWVAYSLNIALNYLIGACTGMVYLKLLARNVEQLGRQKTSLSKSHLALFVGLIVTASQWDQLHIVPIFLGFLTYKAAIIAYMLQTLSMPSSS